MSEKYLNEKIPSKKEGEIYSDVERVEMVRTVKLLLNYPQTLVKKIEGLLSDERSKELTKEDFKNLYNLVRDLDEDCKKYGYPDTETNPYQGHAE